MSVSSKLGGGSRTSDEDGKPTVSVKVGQFMEKWLLNAQSQLDVLILTYVLYSRANSPAPKTVRPWL